MSGNSKLFVILLLPDVLCKVCAEIYEYVTEDADSTHVARK